MTNAEPNVNTVIVNANTTRILTEQSLTIGKAGCEVTMQCISGADANAVFEWLLDVRDKLCDVTGGAAKADETTNRITGSQCVLGR